MWADFDSLEFECVDGKIRSFRGCSLSGLYEFQFRLAELQRLILLAPPDQTLRGLYCGDKHFAWLCNRCLELNGISPDWVNFQQLEQLLFGYTDETGTPQPGYLHQLNAADDTPSKPTPDAPTTEAKAIALLTHFCSLSEALRLAQDQPAKPLIRLLNAVCDQRTTPEQRQKRRFEIEAARLRAEARAKQFGGAG